MLCISLFFSSDYFITQHITTNNLYFPLCHPERIFFHVGSNLHVKRFLLNDIKTFLITPEINRCGYTKSKNLPLLNTDFSQDR